MCQRVAYLGLAKGAQWKNWPAHGIVSLHHVAADQVGIKTHLFLRVRLIFEARAHAAILQYALLPVVVRALQDMRSFRRESHTVCHL